ncbi:MAG: hypothetical protein ABI239_09525 [Aquihabitans sp.]
MTHPGTTPDDDNGPSSQPSSEAASWIQARLDGSGADRLVRYLKRAWMAARLLAALVLIVGVGGLGLGLLVWGSTPAGIVLVVLLSIPGLAGPLMLTRRVGALVRAVTHPDQVVAQARDLVRQLRASPELDELAHRLGGLYGDASPIQEVGRLRKAMRVARLGSQVVGQAQPDRSRHSLLVPFTPDRLTSLWWWLTVSLWGAPLSMFLAFAALLTLSLRQF